MNMMREIWQTTRLALSFRACRRELDAIDQLPNEQLAEREQRLSRLRAINMLEQVCLFIILFSFLLMSIYDIGNYLMQLLHESNTLPFLVIWIISFFPLDDKNLWFVFLYGLFSITTVSILGFGIGYLIPMLYSNCLRELNERAENMDERSATYRLNAALAKMRDRV